MFTGLTDSKHLVLYYCTIKEVGMKANLIFKTSQVLICWALLLKDSMVWGIFNNFK